MIHPQLATMLAVLTTDYPLEPGEAIEFLRPAVERSFNSISVDGECSTNDAVCLLANGASGVERTPATDTAFALALGRVCEQLAEQIVADGEGATVLAEIEVSGAVDAKQARAIARGSRRRRSSRPLSSGTTPTGGACSRRPARRRATAALRPSTSRR